MRVDGILTPSPWLDMHIVENKPNSCTNDMWQNISLRSQPHRDATTSGCVRQSKAMQMDNYHLMGLKP